MMENKIKSAACRACLDTETTKFVTMNENDSFELYEFCIAMKIPDTNGSNVFCIKCSNVIKEFSEFKKSCLKSETIWKSLSENASLDTIFEMPSLKIEEHSNGTSKVKNEIEILDLDNEHYSDEEKLATIKEEWPKLELNLKCYSNKFKGQCDMCSKIYTRKPCLVRHITKCMKGIKKEVFKKHENTLSCCCLCTEEFESRQLLVEHLNGHYLRKELKCMICGFVGRDFAVMIHHRFEHLPKDRKKYSSLICICRKRLVTAYSAEYHFRKTHLQAKGGRCRVCGKEYSSLKKWRNHELLHDDNGHFYTCDICQRKYVFKSDLSEHVANHRPCNYICDVCGHGFSRKNNMLLHRRRVHEQPVWEKCHHCDKTFKGKMSLAKHLSHVVGEKTVKCSFCPKMFMNEKLMMQHRVMHLDVKPYKCDYCDKKFKYKSSYTMHNKSHTGVLKHKCELCLKVLSSPSSLKRHASVHSGARAHPCRRCARSFHLRPALALHEHDHHGDR